MNDLAWSFSDTTSDAASDVSESSPVERDDPLLLVVDATRLASPAAAALSQRGFRVYRVNEFSETEAAIARRRPGLVAIVAGDARGEGLDLCRRLAQRDDGPPILMLTAEDSSLDRILGLELGADDCLHLGCDPRELVARVRALLRRSQRSGTGLAPSRKPSGASDCQLDLARRELRRADGSVTSLSPSELMLLRVFLEHPQEVLGRDRLAIAAPQAEQHGPRTIDVQVSRLRRKLGRKLDGDEVIRTVYGAGYMLTGQVAQL